MRSHRAERTVRRLCAAASAAVALACGNALQANTYTWVGGASGATTTWSNAANWTPTGGPPGAGDEAVFNITTTNQPSLTANASIGEVDFNASGWTIGGTSTLTLNSISGIGILDAASSGTDTISDKISIAAAQTWDVGTGATLTISGAISGSSALTLGDTSGTYGGTVNLTAANTFTGALTVDSGTLELGGSGSINSASGLTLNGGGLLVNGAITVSPTITIGPGNASISATSGNTATISGALSGATNLQIGAVSGDTGTVNLTNANTGFTGAVTIAYGTMGLTGSGSLNAASSITVNSGATLNYNQTATASVPIQDNGSLTVSGGTLTFAGNGTIADNGSITTNATVNFGTSISGGGSITLNGGTDTFTASNSFSGTMAIDAGTVQVSGAGTLSSIGTITIDNGASLLINNTTAAGGNVNNRINNGSTINSFGGTLVYAGSDATSSNGGVSTLNLYGSVITTATVNANGNPASFEFNNLQRNNGTGSNTGGGVLFVNGTNLGSAAGAQIFVSQGTQVVGTSPGSATDKGSGSALNQQIVPYVVGESGTASGAGGTATGTPNTFVTTYSTSDSNGNTVYGLRPLNPTDEFASSINNTTVGDNIYLTTSQSAALTANNSINSLVINGSGSPALTIPDGITLNNASGAILFVTNGTIKPSSSTGTLDFGGNEAIITLNNGVTGTVSTPITGGNALTVNGMGPETTTGIPNTSGTLALTATSAFSGNVYVNDAMLQLGNGTSGSSDGVLPNVAGYFINNGATLNFDDVNPQTITAPITELQSTPGANGSATLLISGPGGVTFSNTITRQNSGFAYIESQNIGPVTFSGSFNIGNMRFYPSGANVSGALVGSYSNQETWTVTNGSIGTSGQAAGTLYWSNNNFATAVTPSPVTMDVTNSGSIYANSLYLGYNGGPLTVNINGQVTLTASLFGAYNPSVANNNSTIYQTLNVGAGGNITALNAYMAYSSGQYQYIGVNNGGQINIINNSSPNSVNFYAANTGDTVMELGTLNGSPSNTGTVNLGANSAGSATQNIIFNGGTPVVSTESSVLNIFAGGNLNIGNQSGGSYGSTGNPGLNAGYAKGQTFTLNIYGGTLSNMIGNAPVYVDTGIANSAAGAGFMAYSVVNLDSDANGTVGKMVTGYLRALPNPAVNTSGVVTQVGSISAFLNFNGGELEFNNVNLTTGSTSGGATQGSFPNNGYVGGIFIFPKGGIFGTNGLEATLGSGVPGGLVNTPNHPILAPTGQGVTSIPVTAGGAGYLSPPEVLITDGSGDTTGIDATGFAVIDTNPSSTTYGQVIKIVMTSYGINYTATPTVTLVGGDPTTPATLGTPTLTQNVATGGFTKVDNGTLTINGGYWYMNPGSAQTGSPVLTQQLTTAQNTYGGPTTVVAGTLALGTVYNASNAVIVETNDANDAATLQINQVTSLNSNTITPVNNSFPTPGTVFVVGDQPANSTLTNVGTLQITKTGTSGVSGFALGYQQVLAGFGNVTGSSSEGLNIGQVSGATQGAIAVASNTSTSNPSAAAPAALTNGGIQSVVSPGYVTNGQARVLLTSGFTNSDPLYGTIVYGSSGNVSNTFTLNTALGNAASLVATAPNATGALTLGNGTGMTTYFGGQGTYYWKLDLSNGGAGQTTQPGTAQVSPGLTSANPNTGNPVPAAGQAWDQLIMDGVSVNSTASGSNAFTVEAVAFSSGNTQTSSGGSSITLTNNNTTMPAGSYSWVIARINQSYNPTTAAVLLADLSLDTTGMPQPASGYEYFLSAQGDPSASSDTDLVLNYAPSPEPTALLLLAPAAGGLMLRRRRRTLPQ